jgi:hypothetical protein
MAKLSKVATPPPAEAATTEQMAALFAPLSQAQREAIVAGTAALESAVNS